MFVYWVYVFIASNTTRLSFLVERYVIKGGGGIEKVILCTI